MMHHKQFRYGHGLLCGVTVVAMNVKSTPKLGPDEWVRAPVASEVLGGTPVATLAYWRKNRRGPAYSKPGKHVLYRVGDLREWMEQNRVRHD